MININPIEVMWNYITFRWSWKPKGKELALELIQYPFKALYCLLILGTMLGLYFIGGFFYSIYMFFYNLFKRGK